MGALSMFEEPRVEEVALLQPLTLSRALRLGAAAIGPAWVRSAGPCPHHQSELEPEKSGTCPRAALGGTSAAERVTGCAEIDMSETELACSRRASPAFSSFFFVALDIVVALEPVALDDQRRDDGFERASRALQAVSRQLPVVP